MFKQAILVWIILFMKWLQKKVAEEVSEGLGVGVPDAPQVELGLFV